MFKDQPTLSWRKMLQASAATTLLALMPAALAAQTLTYNKGDLIMSTIQTRDGTIIYYKDWAA